MQRIIATLLVTSLLTLTAFAHGDNSHFANKQDVTVKTQKVNGNVYMLQGRGGNIGAVVGPEGILIGDDDVGNCRLLPALLRAEGDNYHVTTAYSFAGAQLMLNTRRFDMFITEFFIPRDQKMPRFCRSIKLVSPNSPFIVYSKFDEKTAREEALGAGADLYLVKPFDQDKLCSSIRELIVKTAEQDGRKEKNASRRNSTNIL